MNDQLFLYFSSLYLNLSWFLNILGKESVYNKGYLLWVMFKKLLINAGIVRI